MTIIDFVERFSEALASFVFYAIPIASVQVNVIVLWLLGAMIFFTIRLGFPNLRGFGPAIRTLRGDFAPPDAAGQMTSFQALSTALSGTVGLGNIAGVAIAIAIGGPGATFWMIVIGFLAMNLKFVEVSMAVRFRQVEADGRVSGGPMFYLSRGLAQEGRPGLGKALAYIYAILALFALIQVIQINQSYSQMSNVLALEQDRLVGFIYGSVTALLAGIVLVGGAPRVASITSRLTPAMCALYMLSCIAILIINFENLSSAIATIISSAFSGEAAQGGIVGAFVAGMRRAVYSNEAGIGTATMAHAVVRTDQPVSEGYVALIEPFVDTIVVCSSTALVIVVTGAWQAEHTDIAMTSAAFATIGGWFPTLLAAAVMLFAFSTILAAGFYARQVCSFLFGDRAWAWYIYLAVYCLLLPIGAVVDIIALVNIIDSFFFMLAVPNVIGLYLLTGRMLEEYHAFRAKLTETAKPPLKS